MLKRKQVREKGKIKLSKYFQNLKAGDRVSIIRDLSLEANFPKSIQGRTGKVEGKRGKFMIVHLGIGKGKRFIIHPVHLKKLNA